jgi:Sec-independent protein translocase protein TatA
MFTGIKKWLNKDKNELEARLTALGNSIGEAIASEKRAREEAEAKLAQATEELNVHRKKDEHDKEKYSSVEPWIEIKSDGIDPIKGMVIECDWNPAFIQFLKENGITSKDENVAVQKYIAMLYEDIVNKMDQQIIDNSDKKPKVSDFA